MKTSITIILALVIASGATAQDTSNYKYARRLLELSNSANLGKQMVNQMITTYKEQGGNIPAEFWKEFEESFDVSGLMLQLLPIYCKYMTREDMVEVIRFYESPAGRKLIAALPNITRESYKVGEEWGRKIAEAVLEKMKEKGYISQ